MKILIDTNVMLDFLTKRKPYYDAAKSVIAGCTAGIAEGYIAAHSVINSFYILRKDYTPEQRRAILKDFLTLVKVVGIDATMISRSLLREDFPDYEDCLQSECAAECSAEYIITRNISDFENSVVTPLSPEQFLKMIRNM
ncbi:MAG: PIN domain-containing protein [Lachnospiraceae bacterium]|nr:PIN domain-containing protein [Lachnospiraceae bacterium]